MLRQFRIASLFVLASSLPLAGCDRSSSGSAPTDPSRIETTVAAANRASDRVSPQEFSSGNTDVAIIDTEREITVRVYGDMAVVQNLSTLHGRFNGVPTDTDLRGTFVWVRRNGRWQLLTNQLTAVDPPST